MNAITDNITLTLTAIFIMAVASCSDRHSDYSRFVSLPENGWVYGDTVRIRPVGLDSADTRRLEVAVCNNNDYPYRNLWLEVSYRTDRGVIRDTVEMELADVYGRWLGKGIGTTYQTARKLAARFPLQDSTEIAVRHIMRADTLRGLEQVGLTISDN